MPEKYVCKQEVPINILYGRPEIKSAVVAKNRNEIAHKLAEIICDHEIHSIQLIEVEEPMQQTVSFIAELSIYR